MPIDYSKVDAEGCIYKKDELAKEILHSLGGEFVCDDIKIPSLVAGVLPLLEIIDSPFLIKSTFTNRDVDNILFLLTMKEAAIGVFFSETYAVKGAFDCAVNEFVKNLFNSEYDRTVTGLLIHEMIHNAMRGFELLPKYKSSRFNPMMYDSEWLSGYVVKIHSVTGLKPKTIIWDLPFIMGGFYISWVARNAGEKNIRRPENTEAMIKEIQRQLNNE